MGRSFHFDRVNLLIGNNEEGKTTLTDILIHQLFASDKKNPLVKSLLNNRFDLSKGIDLVWEGEKPELNPYASLLVIREGINQWGGKDGLGLEDTDFWNQEIRNILYGSDGIYNRIKKDIVSLLGVSRSNTWMNVFLSNIQNFSHLLDGEVSRVEQMKQSREEMARLRKEEENLRSKLGNMSGLREESEKKRRLQLLTGYFGLIDTIASRDREINVLQSQIAPEVLEHWKQLQDDKQSLSSRLKALEAKAETLGGTRQELENELKSLQKRLVESQIRKEKEQEDILRLEQELASISPQGTVKHSARGWWTGLIVSLTALLGGALTSILALLDIIQFPDPLRGYFVPGGFVLAGSAFITLVILIIVSITRKSPSPSTDNKEMELRLALQKSLERVRGLDESLQIAQEREAQLETSLREKDKNILSQELEQIRENLRQKLQDEKDWESRYKSYEYQIEIRTRHQTLKDDKLKLEQNRGLMLQEIKKQFSTENHERLHLELKALEKEQSAGSNETDEYKEEDFQTISARRQELSDRIADLDSRNAGMQGQILSTVSRGLKALDQGIQNDKPRQFYQEYQSWDLHGDPWNVIGLAERVREFEKKISEDINYSLILDQAVKNIDGRVDDLVMAVLDAPGFKELWKRLSLGRYVDLGFEKGAKIEIWVAGPDGKRYAFSSLSTGTRNQFYFALRLALASFQLKEAGVLVLDDAFLSFDKNRRKAAVEILKDYSEQGWQVIYTTVNEEQMEQTFSEVFTKNLNRIRLDHAL